MRSVGFHASQAPELAVHSISMFHGIYRTAMKPSSTQCVAAIGGGDPHSVREGTTAFECTRGLSWHAGTLDVPKVRTCKLTCGTDGVECSSAGGR